MTVISRRRGPTTSKWAPKYGGHGPHTVRVKVSSYEMDRPTSKKSKGLPHRERKLIGIRQVKKEKRARGEIYSRPPGWRRSGRPSDIVNTTVPGGPKTSYSRSKWREKRMIGDQWKPWK